MKQIGKIIAYCVGVVLGGACLAPPLYWLAQWAVQTDLIPQLRPFRFEKYFNRAVLVLALGLLWPTLRWLGLRRWTDLRLRENPWRWQDLGIGVVLGAGGLSTLGLLLLIAGELAVRAPLSLWDVLGALLTGVTVAAIEEGFFRGALFGMLRRNLPWRRALVFLTLFFAILHFLRPDPAQGRVEDVTWLSGLQLLPQLFWQFSRPDMVLGTWVTLVLAGWTLGYTVVRTGSLYFALGMHAGWVFALKLLLGATRRQGSTSIWLGDDLRCGLTPALLVLATLALATVLLRRRPMLDAEG